MDWWELLGGCADIGSDRRRSARGTGIRLAGAALLVAVGLVTIAILVLAGA